MSPVSATYFQQCHKNIREQILLLLSFTSKFDEIILVVWFFGSASLMTWWFFKQTMHPSFLCPNVWDNEFVIAEICAEIVVLILHVAVPWLPWSWPLRNEKDPPFNQQYEKGKRVEKPKYKYLTQKMLRLKPEDRRKHIFMAHTVSVSSAHNCVENEVGLVFAKVVYLTLTDISVRFMFSILVFRKDGSARQMFVHVEIERGDIWI